MSNNGNSGNYQAFLKKRSVLLSLIDRQLPLLSALNIPTEVEIVQRIRNRLSTTAFKVLVLGEFKRGKSTFINALLGEKLLPAYSTPCTAIINEIKWGSTPNALLYSHASEHGAKQESKKISVKEIEQYVVIPDLDEPDDDYINPYEKVEIFYPLELCRNGVEIIDSPGLNEHKTRSQVTEEYLSTADAVVFVFTCEAFASQSEVEFIQGPLALYGHEELFFICNKFDQTPEEERERVKRFARKKLSSLTQLGEDGIFFISAYEALQGRLKQESEKIAKSGLPSFEREIERFLTENSGRLKILEPAKALLASIEDALSVIPQRRAMLQTNREKLEKLYLDAQEPLRQLEIRRKQIATRISQFMEDIETQVRDKAKTFYSSLPGKVEAWVDEAEIQSRINLKKVNVLALDETIAKQVKPIVKELSNHLATKVEAEFVPWQVNEIQPFIGSRLEVLRQDVDARTAEFIRQVDELRAQLASKAGANLTKEAMSSLKRLLSSAGKTQQGDRWTAIVFGYGSKKATGSIWGFASLAIVLTLAGVGIAAVTAAPLVAIAGPLLVGAGLAAGESDKVNQRIEAKIREVASQKFAEELKKSSERQAQEFAKDITKKLTGIGQAIDQDLAKEIQSVRDQVESVLHKKNEGQASVDKEVHELASISEKLKALKDELNSLIRELESPQ